MNTQLIIRDAASQKYCAKEEKEKKEQHVGEKTDKHFN